MKKLLLILFLFMCPISIDIAAEGWGFKKNSEHITPEIGKYNEIIKDTKTYYVGDSNKKDIYLTFDVGYDNGNLEKILNILDEKSVRATFFITGDFVNRYDELLVKLSNSNNLICSHSYSHKNITKMTKEEIKNDLDKLANLYYEKTNNSISKYFRPPEGVFDKNSLLAINDLGYTNIFWSVAWKDWLTNEQQGAKYSYESYVNNLHNGAIILMHTVSESNTSALADIIDYSIKNGYIFKTINQID